jgi:hypothetical protein
MAADPTSACPARDIEELLAERGIIDHVTVPVGAAVHPELMEAPALPPFSQRPRPSTRHT